MARWTSQPPQGTSRRKWNLEDRTCLNNLKYQFAEDGCSEIQFHLAKQLLSNEENDHVQGIQWLLRAAHKGHEGAISMLDECYRKGRGITEDNKFEVRACLEMSPGERTAKKAARELFACLSNGEEYITAAQLERKMREIYKIQKKRRRRTSSRDALDDDGSTSNGDISESPNRLRRHDSAGGADQEVITEANLLSAAINYSNGRLPPVSGALTLSVPHPQTLDHIPCFHRLMFHPLLFFSLLYHKFIKIMSNLPDTTLTGMHLLILFVVYVVSSSDSSSLSAVVPTAFYYVSLLIMIISTFKMLKAQEEFVDFRIWSGLFLRYEGDLNAAEPENRFLRNNMKPYLCFFIAFFSNLLLNPIASDQWISHSEITVISFLLMFVTMFAFMCSTQDLHMEDEDVDDIEARRHQERRGHLDIFILISFGINVLAKYPYEMDSVVTTGWRFLDLKIPNFPSFVIGNGIEFCLNCRACLYLLIPGCLIQLARRCNWHGTYQYVIPHCVTLCWLQLCIVSSQCATMFGLMRAALGLAGLLLFLPLFGIVTLMIPVFAAVEWLSLTDPNVRMVATIGAATFAIAASCLMAANHRTDKYITFLQIAACVVATVFLILPYMSSTFKNIHTDVVPKELEWDLYYKYCHQPAWEQGSRIRTQLRCAQLEGSDIKWDGIVAETEISRVKNFRSDLINQYLPTFLADTIACFYGERNKPDCEDADFCDDMRRFFAGRNMRACNLNKWNKYEYQIMVRMHSGLLTRPAEVMIRAQHAFGNFTQNLNASDRIWFKGNLVNVPDHERGDSRKFMSMGSGRPVVQVTAMGCLMCRGQIIESVTVQESGSSTAGLNFSARVKDLSRGMKYLLNVLFNPLLTFK